MCSSIELCKGKNYCHRPGDLPSITLLQGYAMFRGTRSSLQSSEDYFSRPLLLLFSPFYFEVTLENVLRVLNETKLELACGQGVQTRYPKFSFLPSVVIAVIILYVSYCLDLVVWIPPIHLLVFY